MSNSIDVQARLDLQRRLTDVLRRGKADQVEHLFRTITNSGRWPTVPPQIPVEQAVEIIGGLASEGLWFARDWSDMDTEAFKDSARYDDEEWFSVQTPHGRIDNLQGLGSAILVGMVALYMPERVWNLKKVSLRQARQGKLAFLADGASDYLEHGVHGYEMLPDRGREVFVIELPFSMNWRYSETERYLAAGVIYGEIMLSLEAYQDGSGAGTRILNHWKQTRSRLIGHKVMNTAVQYFQKQGLTLLPHRNPVPTGKEALNIMVWNYPLDEATQRVEDLGLPWFEPARRSKL